MDETPNDTEGVQQVVDQATDAIGDLAAKLEQLNEEHRVLTADFQAACDSKATADARVTELTDELALVKAELETANTRVADLTSQLEASRAEFVSGSAPIGDGVEHDDDELCARWINVGGGAKDFELAKLFARSL